MDGSEAREESRRQTEQLGDELRRWLQNLNDIMHTKDGASIARDDIQTDRIVVLEQELALLKQAIYKGFVIGGTGVTLGGGVGASWLAGLFGGGG